MSEPVKAPYALPHSPLPWALEPLESKVPELEDAKRGRVTGLCNAAGDYDIDPRDRAYILSAANGYPDALALLGEAREALEQAKKCLASIAIRAGTTGREDGEFVEYDAKWCSRRAAEAFEHIETDALARIDTFLAEAAKETTDAGKA